MIADREALIAKWQQRREDYIRKGNPVDAAHAERLRQCADELEALLASEPAGADVWDEARVRRYCEAADRKLAETLDDLTALRAERERLQAEIELRTSQMSRIGLCPDHRDKFFGRCAACDKEDAERRLAAMTGQSALMALEEWAIAERLDWAERNADRYWQMERVIVKIERLLATFPPPPTAPEGM